MKREIEASNARWEHCPTCQAVKPLNHLCMPNGKAYTLHQLDTEAATERKHIGLPVQEAAPSTHAATKRRQHWYRF